MRIINSTGMIKRFCKFSCLTVCIFAVSAYAAASEPHSSHPRFLADQATRTVQYYHQVEVTVPEQINAVASAWEAQNSILVMLGAGNKIVATTKIAKSIPAFSEIVPSIHNAALSTLGHPNDINVETLIKLHPDILFVPQGLSKAKQQQLEEAGIAVAAFHDNSLDALVQRVLVSGQLLGPKAEAMAQKYQAYFEHNKRLVAKRLQSIPTNKRLTLYLASGAPLRTDSGPSLNQDWIELGGAINVAKNWHLGHVHYGIANANIESVVQANPDVIVAMNADDAQTILHDPQWQTISAVQNKRVYVNPRGLFFWCRETSEEALQFLWLAKTLYPDQFKDIDMEKETASFYHSFYHTDFPEKEIRAFLHPQPLKREGFADAKQS